VTGKFEEPGVVVEEVVLVVMVGPVRVDVVVVVVVVPEPGRH
jgi:hypothetical protein